MSLEVESQIFRLEQWTVDPLEGTLRAQGKSVRLQPRAMDLLVFLASRPGTLVTKEEILDEVWAGAHVEEGALSQCIFSLRRNLEDDARSPRFIETVPRRGFRLIAKVEDIEQELKNFLRFKERMIVAAGLVLMLLTVSTAWRRLQVSEPLRNQAEVKTTDLLEHGEFSKNTPATAAYVEAFRLIDGPFYSDEGMHKALPLLERAVDLDPTFARAWAELAKARARLSFNGERALQGPAWQALEQAERFGKDILEVRLARAYCSYWADHNYVVAISEFSQATRDRRPLDQTGDNEVLRGVGLASRRLGKLEDAAGYLERAFEIEQRDTLLPAIIAKTYGALRQHGDAETWFDLALKSDQSRPQLLGDRSMNLFAWRGCPSPEDLSHPCSTQEARQVLEAGSKVLTENRDHLSYFRFLFDLFDAAELEGEAKARQFRRALVRLERVPEASRNAQDKYSFFWRQAFLWSRLGEPEKQRALAERFKKILEDNLLQRQDYSFDYAYLGMAHAFLGQSEQAIQMGQKALRVAREKEQYASARQREFLAVIYVLTGNQEEALRHLEELLNTSYQYPITSSLLRVDPIWDSLRGHPRFRRLLAGAP